MLTKELVMFSLASSTILIDIVQIFIDHFGGTVVKFICARKGRIFGTF